MRDARKWGWAALTLITVGFIGIIALPNGIDWIGFAATSAGSFILADCAATYQGKPRWLLRFLKCPSGS